MSQRKGAKDVEIESLRRRLEAMREEVQQAASRESAARVAVQSWRRAAHSARGLAITALVAAGTISAGSFFWWRWVLGC